MTRARPLPGSAALRRVSWAGFSANEQSIGHVVSLDSPYVIAVIRLPARASYLDIPTSRRVIRGVRPTCVPVCTRWPATEPPGDRRGLIRGNESQPSEELTLFAGPFAGAAKLDFYSLRQPARSAVLLWLGQHAGSDGGARAHTYTP